MTIYIVKQEENGLVLIQHVTRMATRYQGMELGRHNPTTTTEEDFSVVAPLP